MKQEELEEVLADHTLWMCVNGGKRANLSKIELTNANLTKANIAKANLTCSNLSGTIFFKANLFAVDLSKTNLTKANLSRANLTDANLTDANLTDANLTGANLFDCKGNNIEIKTIYSYEYIINYTAEIIQIGCENHKISEWWGFDDETISKMNDKALNWWRVWKPIIKNTIEKSPAKKPDTRRNK